MKDIIILTGPIGAGKSTQASLPGEKHGMPVCVYDEVKDNTVTKLA